MVPSSAQPQQTSPISPAITAPLVSSPPKSRLLLYLVGGFILLIIIAVISLEIAPSLLRQKNPPVESQNQPTTKMPPKSDGTTVWRNGRALDFEFQYPHGWHALSGVTESTRYFKLDPEPLYNFPEYVPFIEGNARQEKSDPAQTLETEINYFLSATYPKIEKLDWKNPVFPGECYKYDDVSDQWGELKGNIECLIEITVPTNLPDEQPSRYIYEFSVLNYGNPIEKIDPDLSITKRFIESIRP